MEKGLFKKDNPNTVLGYGDLEWWDDGYEFTEDERTYLLNIFGEDWFTDKPINRYFRWRAYTEFESEKAYARLCNV